MALQVTNHQLNNGISVPEAYVRIETVSGTKNLVMIGFSYYVSREAAHTGVPPLDQGNKTFEPNVKDNAYNFFKQGYQKMKEDPLFEGAKDVLEEGQTVVY